MIGHFCRGLELSTGFFLQTSTSSSVTKDWFSVFIVLKRNVVRCWPHCIHWVFILGSDLHVKRHSC